MYFLDVKTLLFSLIFLFSVCLSLGPSKTTCTGAGLCRCVFPNDLGIDLKKIGGIGFSVPIKDSTKTLLFSPCKDTSFVNGTSCESVSVCLKEVQGNLTTYHNLGNAVHGKLIWERIFDTPKFQYSINETITDVTCNCLEDGPANVTVVSTSKNLYELSLTASECCIRNVAYGPPTQHGSVIGILAIILLVIFLLYLIGGFLVLRFIRGAEGVEAIPNSDFWLSLPDKIKHGFLWLLNGCKSQETYDRI